MLPAPWLIEELERLRREEEQNTAEHRLPRYIEDTYSEVAEQKPPETTRTVIVIEL